MQYYFLFKYHHSIYNVPQFASEFDRTWKLNDILRGVGDDRRIMNCLEEFPGNLRFSKVHLLNLDFFNHTKNIALVLASSLIKIWRKSVNGFIS